ncbi:MAG: hypothetical protein ACE5EW_03885 [Thermoplasmata archaeon]
MRALSKALIVGLLNFIVLLSLGHAMAADVGSDDDTNNTLGATVASNPPDVTAVDITNAADGSLMHAQLDVGTTYYFNVTISDPDGWGDLQWANVHIWFDGGSSEIAYSAQSTGANYRADLNYTNVAPLTDPALSEWSIVEGNVVYASGSSSIFTNVNQENYTFKLAFTLNNQVRQASEPTTTAPSVGYNDLDSWNMEVRAKDFGNPDVTVQDDDGSGSGVHFEFGVFQFNNVSIGANWDAGTISPGGDATTAIVTVTHVANDNHRLSVWFDTHLVDGANTIDITNVNITAAGDPGDAITVDTFFGGLGVGNREYIHGSAVSTRGHDVAGDSETTGVQFGVSVPFGTPSGTYVANLTIRVETP